MDTNENNASGRASYTEDERRELIEEFNASGLTQAAFCREWNINPKTLARWLRIEREDAEVSFCEVDVQAVSASDSELKICLPNGIAVQLHIPSLDDLGTVMREVARCLD
jgi:transposase-like protein